MPSIPRMFMGCCKKNSKKRHGIFVLTKVNGFAFCPKMLYLCSTRVEIPRQNGLSPLFYAIFRRKIGKITRRIRKNICRKGKIVSILVKIMSIFGARRSLVIYKTSIMNVNVC